MADENTIGLQAVIEDDNLNSGAANYANQLDSMSGATDSAAAGMTGGFSLIDGAILELGGQVLHFAEDILGDLIGSVGDFVNEASEAEQAAVRLETVIKSTGGAAGITAEEAGALATAFQATTTFSDEMVMSAEGVLLRFTSIGEDVFPNALEATLDIASAMGTDASSAARTLGLALEDPTAAAGKLKRAGIVLSDSQQELIKTMVEAGDIAGAQAIVLDAVSTSVGGTAAAMGDTYAGKLAIFTNTMSDMKEQIGGAILPALTPLIDMFTNLATTVLPPLIEQFTAWLTPALASLSEWLSVNIPIAIQAVSDYFTTTLQPALIEVWGWMEESLFPTLATLFEWLAENIPPAISALADFWTGTLQPALEQVWAWMQESLFPALQVLFEWLGEVIPPVVQGLADFWTGVLQPALEQVWSWMEGSLFPTLQILFEWLGEVIPPVIQVLADFWTGVLQPAIAAVWSWMEGSLFPTLGVLFDWLATTIPPIIQAMADLWTGTLQPALLAVWDFLDQNVFPLFEALGELFSVALTLALTALAGLWENVLLPALTAVWEFLSDSLQPVFQAVSDFVSATLGPVLQDLTEHTIGPLELAFGAISAAISGVIGWIEDMIEALRNVELPSWLTPGSPTPFEIGLWGIGEALGALNMDLRDLSGNMDSVTLSRDVAGMQTITNTSRTMNQDNTFNMFGMNDLNLLQSFITQSVRQALETG